MTKYQNTKFSSAVIFVSIVTISPIALAGDVDMYGPSDDTVYVENTYTGSSTRTAVSGEATNVAGHGRGGCFSGGYIGVQGVAKLPGSGRRYGVKGIAKDGTYSNYGVYGEASGARDYAGYFNGDVYTTAKYKPSDERLKEDITDLYGSLDQVMQLRPKSYRFRTEAHPNKNLPEGYHMGLLAQDVEQVFPDLIREVPAEEDENNRGKNDLQTTLATNYDELIPVLVGAIQEQQEQIAELQEQVAGCGCR